MSFVFNVDVPGMKEDEIELHVVGNRLTISGRREEEERHEDDRYYAYERSYGSFSRAFTMPETADLDHISAELKNGVLGVKVPKKAEVQPKRISIQGQQQQQAQISPPRRRPARRASSRRRARARLRSDVSSRSAIDCRRMGPSAHVEVFVSIQPREDRMETERDSV